MPSSSLLTDVSADVWKGCARRAVAAVVARLCASVRYTQKYANDIWHHRFPRPSSVAPCWRKALNPPSTHTHTTTTTSWSKLLVLLFLPGRWKEWKDVDFCFLCLCFYCESPTELNGTLHSSSFITWCHCTECNISTRLTEWLFCFRSVWSGNRSLKAWPAENCSKTVSFLIWLTCATDCTSMRAGLHLVAASCELCVSLFLQHFHCD